MSQTRREKPEEAAEVSPRRDWAVEAGCSSTGSYYNLTTVCTATSDNEEVLSATASRTAG